jgi:Magnesium chelatase, subunit ChlI C-terminal/Magnesium chelatase, subunit ChlI
MQIQRYVSKISGPLLDRIDIHIDVPAVKFKELASETPAESSADIRERVVRARHVQLGRFTTERIYCNAQMSPRLIRKYCAIVSAGIKLSHREQFYQAEEAWYFNRGSGGHNPPEPLSRPATYLAGILSFSRGLSGDRFKSERRRSSEIHRSWKM